MNSFERMTDSQIAKLAGAICATGETLGQTVSASAAKMMAEDLADYPPVAVREALRACRRELTGKLTLAAILQRVNAADGRPGRDEAWSIALQSADEFETVVMTAEIQKAMAAAAPILEQGDKVGARMAFLSAYDRHCSEARNQGAPVKWEVSLGFDPDRRRIAIENAKIQGLLPPADADRELARLEYTMPPSDTAVAIAGLITGKVSTPSAEARERIAQLKADLAATQREKAERLDREAREALDRLNQSKAQAEAAIAELEQRSKSA